MFRKCNLRYTCIFFVQEDSRNVDSEKHLTHIKNDISMPGHDSMMSLTYFLKQQDTETLPQPQPGSALFSKGTS